MNTLKYNQIRANLTPMLRKNEHFDFETAKTIAQEYLTQLMALTDNEIKFIEHFNIGIYHPNLLFDDEGIIERIKEHPMALWKIKNR